MILKEIEIVNFRQFYGKQYIRFAQGEENITIVFGDNGKGKTGIFRALMYGLYGSRYIQQDNTNDIIHLVNLKKLNENEGSPVNSSVKLVFSKGERQYIITRRLRATKNNNDIIERDDGVELLTTDVNGNFNPEPETNPQKVQTEINKVLNENIKDFFLFDAEKIDTLAKTDSHVKKEVKTAIFKLLQIEDVEKAGSILQSLFTKQNKSVVENSKNIDLERKNQEINDILQRIESNKKILKAKEENLDKCREEQNELQQKLSQDSEIKSLQETKKKELEFLNILQEQYEDQKKAATELLIKKAPNLLMHDFFVNISNYLDQIVSKQDNIVPIEVLERSLKTKICSCCNNDLSSNEKNYRHVLLLKDSYKRSEIVTFAGPIKSMITDSMNEFDEAKEKVLILLEDIRKKRKDIEIRKKVIDDINLEIDSRASTQSDINILQNTLKKCEEDEKILVEEIAEIKHIISEDEKSEERLQLELERMMSENESLKFDSKVLKFIRELRTDIKKISEEFSSEMRNELMKETTNIFKTLIDRKDRGLIKQIVINEQFEIEIIAWDDTVITQDISQGQRQIVALSFISALAKVAAGKSNRISFPLFMDTPFGRISGNNRDHLIENLPTLTSQWILLLTDTELTHEEERAFKDTKKLGKWYRLDQKELYYSKIEEIDLNMSMATRG